MSTLHKNQPHTKIPSVVGNLKTTGDYTWVNPLHAATAAEYKYNEIYINPHPAPANTFFQATNNHLDFLIPQHLEELMDLTVEATVVNTGATPITLGASPHFMFDRYEILRGSDVIKSYTPLDAYLNDTLYFQDTEIAPHEAETRIDATTRDLHASHNVIAGSSSETVYIHVPNFLTVCQIAPCTLRDELTLRCYSATNWTATGSMATSAATTATFRLLARVRSGAGRRLKANSRLDYRFLDQVSERFSEPLVAGTQKSIRTTNFHAEDMTSHFIVLLRATGSTGEQLIQFLPATSVHLEDESGSNLTNGQVWTSAQMLQVIFPRKFKNTMSQQPNKAIYVPFCPSLDPSSDRRKGACSGSGHIPDRSIVQIVPASSATREVHLHQKIFRHARIQNGVLTIR
jgi:hypothetical protein